MKCMRKRKYVLTRVVSPCTMMGLQLPLLSKPITEVVTWNRWSLCRGGPVHAATQMHVHACIHVYKHLYLCILESTVHRPNGKDMRCCFGMSGYARVALSPRATIVEPNSPVYTY